MLKFTFVKNDAKNMALLTNCVSQVCSTSAPLRDVAIVYATVNIQVVKR